MIGENIKQLIHQKGITVDFLAENLGVSIQNIYKMFKRDSIESKHLIRISELLDIPIGRLFGGMVDSTYPGKSNKELESEMDNLSNEYSRVLKSNEEQIKFLKEQVEFYKEQSESYKIMLNTCLSNFNKNPE